jgi:hypothetical protein
MLKLDMSRTMVVSGASKLLAAGPKLRERYHWQASGSEIRYTQKVFRYDTVRFKDKYYHLHVDVSSLGSKISMIPLLSSLCPTLSSPPSGPWFERWRDFTGLPGTWGLKT